MARKTLRFGIPRDITPAGLTAAIKIRFPLTMVDSESVGAPDEHQRTIVVP